MINGEVAEFNARGVNVTDDGEVLDSDAKYYLNQPKAVMKALVGKFKRSEVYNYHLRNVCEREDGERIQTLLLPSHPYLDDPIVIENVRYLTISEKTFTDLYKLAGIAFDEPPQTASSIFASALNLY